MAKSVKTAKPTGLTITRSGNKFTFSWKKGSANYDSGQELQYKLDGTWIKLSIGKKETSKAIEISTVNYYPPEDKPKLETIAFRVRGKRSTYRKSGKTYKPTMSDWATLTQAMNVPNKPTLTATLGDVWNVCTFAWNVETSDTDMNWFTDVEWQTMLLKDSNETDGSKLDWSEAQPEWETNNGIKEDSKQITEDTFNLADGSYTRWFRVRARGVGGASGWTYANHVYALPYQAVVESAVAYTLPAGGFQCKVVWEATSIPARPIDKTTVEYCITVPDDNMECPDGASWTSANLSADTEEKDAAVFPIDRLLANDQCLFIRVNTEHDGVSTTGIPILAEGGVGYLADPSGVSVELDETTFMATVEATNNSQVPDSFLVIVYRPASDLETENVVGIIEHGETSANVQAPDWSSEESFSFGVYAAVGDPNTITRDSAIMKSRNITWKGGEIPVAPSNVEVSATSISGTIRVSWDWSWAKANGAELSWADHEDAWESTDQPDRYEISNIHAGRWNISGLETGIKWYIKVRFISGSGDNKTYSPYSETKEIDLTSAPSIPTLVLSDSVITQDGSITASWVYTTTDGTEQSYAEICEATITQSGINHGRVIAHTQTAQHVTINAQNADWQTGETYNLCVRVVSASGRVSDEWSDPVPVTIAEPLECTIAQTSLENETIETNPRTFSGNPISFETEMEEQFAELELTLDPIQDLHGYDSPWVGGAGVNQWDEEWELGYLDANGTPTSSTNNIRSKNFNNCLPNTSYCIHNGTNENITFFEFDDNQNYVDRWSASAGANRVVTTSANTRYFKISTSAGITTYNHNIAINYPSTITTYSPYSNMCPISGHDSVDVVHTGVNVWDEEWRNGYYGSNGVFYATPSSPSNLANTNPISVKPNTAYYFKAPTTNSNTVCWYDADMTLISANTNTSFNTVITSPNNARYLSFKANYTGVTVSSYNNDISINYPSTDHDYHAYQGQTYTTQLGQTVYGGVLDVVSGLLTVTHGYVDLGTLTWSYSTDRVPRFGATFPFDVNYISHANVFNGASSAYEIVTFDALYNPSTSVNGTMAAFSATRMAVRDDAYTDPTAFQQAVSGVQLVYELATPQTYQLTPQQIATLVEVNKVWSDFDMEVRIAESSRDILALKEMPLTVTVTGAGEGGTTMVVIERAESYQLDRPDDDVFNGYEGETVFLKEQLGEEQLTFALSDALSALDDGAKYRIKATVYDGLGQSDTKTLIFEVRWREQALIPDGQVEVDDDDMIAKITPIAPQGVRETDVCDIYRLSADKPELVVENAQFGETYVDPYATFNRFGGYRFVFKTQNGDYITEDGTLAWTDIDEPIIETEYTAIDFSGGRILLLYNVDTSSSWEKDFQQTKYLGGSVEGDWNPAVTRNGSINAVALTLLDEDTISMIRRLAVKPESCHIRTKDGSSYDADVQVSETYSHDNRGIFPAFTFSTNRIDTAQPHGMTLAQWEAMNEDEENELE